jgi:predicted NBD/HSP70 family sugar kinase
MPARSATSLHARFLRPHGDTVATPSERVLLDLVRKAGTLSRADLTRASGLSAPGAKTLIDGLVERALLSLGPAQVRGRGQPSAVVSLVAQHAFSVGLSIMVDGYSLSLVDLSGRVVVQRSRVAFPLKLAQATRQIARDVQTLITKAAIAQERVFGVGVGMTGPFAPGQKRVNPPLSMPEEWAAVDIAEHLSATLGHPVWMDNDANCAANAEAVFGLGRECRNFVYLHFTDGFGGGVIQDGKLVCGHHGNAGELGRLFAATGLQRPTLESLRQRLVTTGMTLPDLHSMLAAYDPTWPQIDGWIASVEHGMTLVVAAICALCDPEAIVFGERLPADLASRLAAAVRFEERPRRNMQSPGPALVASRLTGNAVALGAAMLPFKEHYFL